jgi:hypothetical protein
MLDILLSEFGIKFNETLNFINIPALTEKLSNIKQVDQSIALAHNDKPVMKVVTPQAMLFKLGTTLRTSLLKKDSETTESSNNRIFRPSF